MEHVDGVSGSACSNVKTSFHPPEKPNQETCL